jgi:hypothetical protein
MPLQNRVNPWGKLIADNARGAWLGNRGVLHNKNREIIAEWKANKPWITCILEVDGYKREVFSPNQYSELFFLDEATAFSAGHRPCGQCQREKFNKFKSAWGDANNVSISGISVIDEHLHIERIAQPDNKKVTFKTTFKEVPEGTFIELDGSAYLYWANRLHLWSFNGYIESIAPPSQSTFVHVLTPISIVRMFHNGFKPQVHETASL